MEDCIVSQHRHNPIGRQYAPDLTHARGRYILHVSVDAYGARVYTTLITYTIYMHVYMSFI